MPERRIIGDSRAFLIILKSIRKAVVIIKKAVCFSPCLISGEGVKMNLVYASENVFFDIGIVTLELFYQSFYFLTLAASASVVAHGAVFGKSAGTLDKLKVIIAFPCDNRILMNTVHRSYKFNAVKVCAVKLGYHRL